MSYCGGWKEGRGRFARKSSCGQTDTGWVAGAIETSRRRDVLSWSHHREVAGLIPKEQDRLLDLAARVPNWFPTGGIIPYWCVAKRGCFSWNVRPTGFLPCRRLAAGSLGSPFLAGLGTASEPRLIAPPLSANDSRIRSVVSCACSVQPSTDLP